jgi:hypothetical protein
MTQKLSKGRVVGYLVIRETGAQFTDEIDGVYATHIPTKGETYAVCDVLGSLKQLATLQLTSWNKPTIQPELPPGSYIVRPFVRQKAAKHRFTWEPC